MESVKIDVLIEFSFKCKSVVLSRMLYVQRYTGFSKCLFPPPFHVLVPSIDAKESKLVKPGTVLTSPRTA